jgi:hypothetical protein
LDEQIKIKLKKIYYKMHHHHKISNSISSDDNKSCTTHKIQIQIQIVSHGKFDSKGEEVLLIDFKLDEQLSFYSCIPLHVCFE